MYGLMDGFWKGVIIGSVMFNVVFGSLYLYNFLYIDSNGIMVNNTSKPTLSTKQSESSLERAAFDKFVEKHSISEELLLLRAESVLNHSSSGMSIKAIKIDRTTKDIQIIGFVPIVIQITYENVQGLKEPINSVVYASIDGKAFVPGVVNDEHGGIYGLNLVRKQLAEYKKAALNKSITNPVVQTNPNPTILVGKTEKAIVQGNGLKLGKDGMQLSKNNGKENVVVKKQPERVSSYKGEDLTPTTFWNNHLAKTNWIKDGKDGAPIFYVFFDPWCSACHKLFNTTRDLVKNGKVQLRWIGFGLMPNYPGHPAGVSSLDTISQIYSANDKEKAFIDYMGSNKLANVTFDKKRMYKQAQDNVDLEKFITNGGNPTPTLVFRSKGGILGVKIGMTAKMIGVVVNSSSYNN